MPDLVREARIVRARKRHRCDLCHLPIPVGCEHTRTVWASDGSVYTFREHVPCAGPAAEEWAEWGQLEEGCLRTGEYAEHVAWLARVLDAGWPGCLDWRDLRDAAAPGWPGSADYLTRAANAAKPWVAEAEPWIGDGPNGGVHAARIRVVADLFARAAAEGVTP
jgi:hypothetical protein